MIESLANAIYVFGFVFMTPQLFINYKCAPLVVCLACVHTFVLVCRGGLIAGPFKRPHPNPYLNGCRLKSVAHMPWRVMGYKAFNTFIDDAFR